MWTSRAGSRVRRQATMKARGESALLEREDQRRAEGSLWCRASRWKVGGNEREGRRVVPGAA
jgi:hypothetical protein